MDQAASQRAAANVRAELARSQLTQADLAELLGWSESAISRRVNGPTRWTLDDIEIVAAALNVDVNALTGWLPDPAVT